MKKGIDISYYQGAIDFAKVKKSGISFVIMRASIGLNKDKMVEQYYYNCKDAGLDYGFYHFLKATTEQAAVREANFFVDCIKGKNPTYPVYLDFETTEQLSLPKQKQISIINSFMQVLESKKYYAGIYMSKSPLANLGNEITDKYDTWIASWHKSEPVDSYMLGKGIWQYAVYGKWGDLGRDYTIYGQIDGINANCDVNRTAKDYPSIIAKAGLNKYGFEESIVNYKELYEAEHKLVIKLVNEKQAIFTAIEEIIKKYS